VQRRDIWFTAAGIHRQGAKCAKIIVEYRLHVVHSKTEFQLNGVVR
jgi:hypothetical protein